MTGGGNIQGRRPPSWLCRDFNIGRDQIDDIGGMCTLLVKQVALGEFDEEETGEKKRRGQEQGDTQDYFGTQAGSHLQPIVL